MKLWLLVFSCLIWISSAFAETHTITMENMEFNPKEITIHAGDEIVWVNKDMVPHTATGEVKKNEAKKKSFDSKLIATGQIWKNTFTAPGALNYFCSFHPTMKGKITVVKKQ